MIELLGTICTAISIIGVLLNNYKRREGFIVWLVSNSMAFIIHGYLGVYSLAIRDLIFFVLAVHGYWKWGKK